MTESEWLSGGDASVMLASQLRVAHLLVGNAVSISISDRKLRLFACACCRQVWYRLPPVCRQAVEATESFAEEKYRTADDAITSAEKKYERSRRHCAGIGPHNYVWNATVPYPQSAASNAVANAHLVGISPIEQADLLREIVGTPHRPVTLCGLTRKPFHNQFAHVDQNGGFWLESECPVCAKLRTPQVLTLARVAYEARLADGTLDPLTLCAVADALEEAGCTADAVLAHLRSPGPHVRGCWALDLVLEKT